MQQLLQTSNCPPMAHDCAGVLLDMLPGLMRFVRRHMRGRRGKRLSVPQFRTLVQLRRRPAASLSSISDCLGSSLPTTSRIVSGLVTKRLVVRKTAAKDRRQSALQLTARGQAVIDAAWSGTQNVVAERFANLSPDELATLAKALELLARTFPTLGEEADEPAGGSLPPENGLAPWDAHTSTRKSTTQR